jgi:predicted nuclease of predicted toxin-antitoxin system
LTTKLKLLLDESVPNPLADQLMSLPSGSVHWQYVRTEPLLKGASDPTLIEYATRHGMIVVTVETAMNERAFKICTHSGIIVISTREHHEIIQCEVFRKFLLSGYRKYARHAVTYITSKIIVVRGSDGERKFPIEGE